MPREPRASLPLAVLALAALAAGAAHSLLFSHTAAWPTQLLLLALLVRLIRGAPPARAGLLGWCFGTAWIACGTWWLFVSMHRYGGLAAPLAAAAVLLLAAFLSLYFGAATAAFARWRRGVAWRDALLFAVCWTLAEGARALVLTGFPWLATGYAQLDSPLAALAPWVGVYGIGTVVAALGALLASGRMVPVAVVALAVLVLALLPPAEFSRPAGRLDVSLLQTNVPQEQKFDPALLPGIVDRLAAQLQSARGELVLAPETAIPVLPGDLGDDWWRPLRQHFASGGRTALLGLPLWSDEGGYTNSLIALSAATGATGAAATRAYRYDKHHLVPFGEFIPTGFRWFTNLMHIPLGDFARGPLAAPSLEHRARDGSLQRIAPGICYEDLFGEELAARFADAASAPTVISNHSNIAWFGDTVAIPQHLNISRMRTLEFERPLLRSTNTGATAVIDHRGRVMQALPSFERGTLEGSVETREGLTPYARWAAWGGPWPPLLLALGVLLLLARGRGHRAP